MASISIVMAVLPFALAQGPLPQTGEIWGTVRDVTSKPVAGASVLLQQKGRESPVETKAGEDGGFRFPSLPAGTYAVRVQKVGYRDATQTAVTLSSTEKKRCEFVLEPFRSPTSTAASTSRIELDDKPNFAIAGVTDSTASGGHGSETRMRTGDVLAAETAKLQPEGGEELPTTVEGLSKARERARSKLADGTTLSKKEEGDLRRGLGDLDEKLDDPLAAEREYERSVELDPSERNYFAWGAELLLHRAIAPAMEVFGRGSRLHPDSARMLAGLAAALFTSGSVEEAAERLCQASDLEPASADPYWFLGRMQEASPTPLPCAEERLARFARNQPASALADYYYALALWKRDRGSGDGSALHDAEVLLEKASVIDTKFDLADLQLGNLRFARAALPEAIAAYRRAIAKNPRGSEAHYRLGLAYRRLGEETKAQAEFERCKQLEKAESSKVERQRRELRQFLFVLKPPPDAK